MSKKPSNDEIAEVLERIADILEIQHASIYRIRAYRVGAGKIRDMDESIAEMLAADESAPLEKLPTIGKSLASVIREFASTGRTRLLERLEGQTSPADLFATVPGIGEELAERIEAELHLDTLEDLEAAAHDGRLDSVSGFGPRRVRGVQETLGNLLRYASARRSRAIRPPGAREVPSVAVILDVDRTYLDQAGKGLLRMIAPRRFNPDRRAWLPILHKEVEGWAMTAMFSNTARAHQLGRTGEWVVVYFDHDGHDGQCTVVTERSGRLKGKRVVRGRENACIQWYNSCEPND